MNKRNILLCVSGMTPQIITETLFALHKKGERIDEVRVITTLEGRNKVLHSLLDAENGKFYEFCRDFGLDASKIKFDETTISLLDKPDGTTLSDIRTVEDNIFAGDKICKIVAELCKDENTLIHASAAGGRKTMSIYLTAAMQLFGRAEDTLSHVLVSEDFEGHPQFFYPPPIAKMLNITDRETKKVLRQISTENAEVYLAEVPFILLRGIGAKAFDTENKTYKQAVEKAQKNLRLAESINELRLDLKRNLIKVGDRQVKLSLREMFIYAMFAFFKKAEIGDEGFVNLREISRAQLDAVCRLFYAARDKDFGYDDFQMLPKSDFIRRLDLKECQTVIYEIKSKKFVKRHGREPEKNEIRIFREEVFRMIVKTIREINSKAEPKLKAVFTPEELFEDFYVSKRGVKEAHIYGLSIDARRIKFEHEHN